MTTDSGTQTDELHMSKQELMQLKTEHEKEITTLKREKEEERKGTRMEFSKTKYNAKFVHINTAGALINRQGSPTSTSGRRLRKYAGTSSIVPLPRCESRQYFEVKTNVGIVECLSGNNLLFEIGMTTEENQDKHPFVAKYHDCFSLTVQHCSIHRSICRKIWRNGDCVMCVRKCLKNKPGTLVTLHFGVAYDGVLERVGFIDVKKEEVIGEFIDVTSIGALWPMFGVYNSPHASISMSLVVGSDIEMTERKKTLISKSLLNYAYM